MKGDPEYLVRLSDLAEQTAASCTGRVPDRERERQSYRNRAKITAVIENARSFRAIIDRHGSFRAYLRSFSEGFPEGVGDPSRILDDLDRADPLCDDCLPRSRCAYCHGLQGERRRRT